MHSISEKRRPPLAVHITVDVEVWPVHPGAWPHVPLTPEDDCRRELAAYFYGECAEGPFGLPYQLKTLRQHGLRGTFFVDPMFSFALGLEPLRDIVALVQSAGQRIELHLHPEWLTDPRSKGMPEFRGPMLGDYPEDAQLELIEIALDRLTAAGAQPITAFRAGSWGASASTLRAVKRAGLMVDASLNAHYPYSLGDLQHRSKLQLPTTVGDLIEIPVTRFKDGRTANGRPLSIVGVSFQEMRFVLDNLSEIGASSAVLVLHSNEFVKTENLWTTKALEPRRWVARRFERICAFLAARSDQLETRFIADHAVPVDQHYAGFEIVDTGFARTMTRLVGQAISRWY